MTVQHGSSANSTSAELTAAAYEELMEAYSALQIENSRLAAEVTQLKIEIADLSYGKLTNSQTISPDQPVAPEPADADYNALTQLLSALSTVSTETYSTAVPAAISDLVANRRVSEAKLFAALAVRMSPGKPDMHMRWVRQVRYKKEFDVALAMCNACFAADGDLPDLRLNRGYLLYEAGQYETAADDLEVAGHGRPNSIEEKLVAASARKRLGQIARPSQKELMAGYFRPEEATFSAERLDPAAVKRSLARYGCAWIRGLFNPNELTHLDQTIAGNLAGMQDVFKRLGLPTNFGTVGFPLYFASEEPNAAHRCYEQSYPALFDPGKMAGVDNTRLPKFVFGNLRRTGLHRIIREYLGMDRLYVSAAACHIRSMIPQGFHSFGEFHQDNRLYNSDAEILTLWFPFRYQHGPMPSLEFLPVRSDSHFPCVSVCGIHNDMFEPDVFWRPQYELGDAMLLSGFSPHRTYFEADMTLERTSIDFRIFASPLPEPIFEDPLSQTTQDIAPRRLAKKFLSSIRRATH